VAVVLAWAFDFTSHGLERTASDPESVPADMSWLSGRTVVAVRALVTIAAVAGWLVGGSRSASLRVEDEGSIAVLPFDDFSSQTDQEWFAAGMQEALITALQQIGALRVTSRRSAMLYRETGLSSPEIAEQLRVRWLVEGSVVRAGGRVRITAQLINGSSDRQVWARQYERDVEDILALQNEVARAIAAEVDIALTPGDERRLAMGSRLEPETYRAYVLGLHHLYRITPDDFRRSIPYFEESIARDSTFAPAHAALAVSYGTAVEYDWISREDVGEAAERAAEAAIRLDPESSEAYHALGGEFHMRHDLAAAERAFREAMARNPTAYALQDYGWPFHNPGATGRPCFSWSERCFWTSDPR
jgi:TolB-like protein